MSISRCRSCKAEIIWVETIGGSKVPLDAKAEKRYVDEVLGPAGQTGGKVVLVDTYLSHFVTCPQADEWRKKRKGATHA